MYYHIFNGVMFVTIYSTRYHFVTYFSRNEWYRESMRTKIMRTASGYLKYNTKFNIHKNYIAFAVNTLKTPVVRDFFVCNRCHDVLENAKNMWSGDSTVRNWQIKMQPGPRISFPCGQTSTPVTIHIVSLFHWSADVSIFFVRICGIQKCLYCRGCQWLKLNLPLILSGRFFT